MAALQSQLQACQSCHLPITIHMVFSDITLLRNEYALYPILDVFKLVHQFVKEITSHANNGIFPYYEDACIIHRTIMQKGNEQNLKT